jgi:hypothetical protein
MKRVYVGIFLLAAALPFAQARAQSIPPIPHFTTEQVCPRSTFSGMDAIWRECISGEQSGLDFLRRAWPLVSSKSRDSCLTFMMPALNRSPERAYSVLAKCVWDFGRDELTNKTMPDHLNYR